MTTYRTALPGDGTRVLVAHLHEGDSVVVQTSLGEQTYRPDPDRSNRWLMVHDDEVGLRYGWWWSAEHVGRDTSPRLRPPLLAAAKSIRNGGCVLAVREVADRYGRPELQYTGHEVVEPEEVTS